mgnify:CR=1 FL=1|tara:strand:- start:821 stop:1360 length:540 start_codon:yes stop_codon:yes gene_type:complete
MKIDKEKFKTLNMQGKIDAIIQLNKKKIVMKGAIDYYIYLVDSTNALHVIDIDNKKYLDDPDYSDIFRGIVKSIISDFSYEKVKITNLFYMKECYFNSEYKNINNVNLDSTFNKQNANECLLIYSEDKVNMKLTIYDKITGIDKGQRYTVLSNIPIKEVEYCKFDPDDNLKGTLTNIIR